MNGGAHNESGSGLKTRSSSLAATGGSAPRNIPGQGLPDPIGTGSPREGSRLYERGGTSVSSSFGAGNPSTSVFSSSFPSSGGIWSNDPKAATSSSNINTTMPPPTSANPARTSLSRHLSLSGTMPKTAIGLGPVASPGRSSSASAWPDSPLSVEEVALSSSADYRQGRSRTRMYGNSPGGSGGTTPSGANTAPHEATTPAQPAINHLARSLSIASDRTAASSIGGPGIAISNMSPFVRDTRGLPSAPVSTAAFAGRGASGNVPASAHPYSSSFSTSHDFFNRGPNTATGDSFGGILSGYPGAERTAPPNHGAVGSGRTASMAAPVHRKRRESLWDSDRPLRERDEDAYYDAEDDDEEDYAPPTRSGATSRRHSVAAFTSSSTLTALTSPPAIRSQIGFQLPSESSDKPPSRSTSAAVRKSGFSGGTGGGATFSIGGSSSRLDDEDLLATDLSNALQMNLEAHAARQRKGEHHESRGGVPPTRPGYDSRSSSMPVQAGNHFDRPVQSQTSPFGSLQIVQPLPAALESSPPARAAGASHDRRASASGDPYSPSASAARFLATAHHVQPPPFQPQTSSSYRDQSSSRQQQYGTGRSPDHEAGNWPASGTSVFAQHQQSPSFRSGALPSPDQVRNFSNQGHMGLSASPAGGPPPSNGPYSFMSGPAAMGGQGNRGVSPAAPHATRVMSPPSSLGFLPPFAGFPAAPHMSGPPPPSLSPLNASAHPYFVPPIAPQPNLNDLGRGVPLHALPSDGVSLKTLPTIATCSHCLFFSPCISWSSKPVELTSFTSKMLNT